ncbi:unnamed protein product [Psylliodes chrysocephalus]|uniref:Uncharacterized protein n=1 Tax=Psylliodes chrysocephalus TaxID=3402493 RepID=A0A9P0G5F9_9CUCU|nr:unnamed protein product [Psylliodes chrysocephala]
MEQAGLEELQLAKDIGEVDEQGKGLIAVIVEEPEEVFDRRAQSQYTDIKNSPYHTFGNHSNCAQYFCKREQNDRDYVTEMEEYELMDDIVSAENRLVQNSHSLLLNMTKNAAETYNSIVAKFIRGKRINFSVKGAYII